MKSGGIGIPEIRLSAENVYNPFKSAIEVLVGSLLGCTNLNYIAHKGCVRRTIGDGWKQRELAEKAVLLIRK